MNVRLILFKIPRPVRQKILEAEKSCNGKLPGKALNITQILHCHSIHSGGCSLLFNNVNIA